MATEITKLEDLLTELHAAAAAAEATALAALEAAVAEARPAVTLALRTLHQSFRNVPVLLESTLSTETLEQKLADADGDSVATRDALVSTYAPAAPSPEAPAALAPPLPIVAPPVAFAAETGTIAPLIAEGPPAAPAYESPKE